jgi:hypothetical protein
LPKKRIASGEELFDPHEFHDPAGDVPVLDVEIPGGVSVGAVRAAEDAFDPWF